MLVLVLGLGLGLGLGLVNGRANYIFLTGKLNTRRTLFVFLITIIDIISSSKRNNDQNNVNQLELLTTKQH